MSSTPIYHGQRVQMTAEAQRRLLRGKINTPGASNSMTGVCVSRRPRAEGIRVLRDGHTAVESYWRGWWQLADDETPRPDQPAPVQGTLWDGEG